MIAQSVAEILSHHVKLTVEGIDRMYLNVYVPRLQCETGIVGFFRNHRGNPLPSSALMKPMSREFVAKLEKFVAQHQIPLVQFHKGQRKDDVMKQHLRQFQKEEGILFVGKAQEKSPVFRTERRRSPKTGQPYPWIVRSTAMVNHYYIYALDRDFGPFFLKFCSYFPFNGKLCLNGHEYAKRQLVREGIKFEPLDNGVLSCANPKRLQKICDGLSAEKIDGLLRKWLRFLPHPYTGADRKPAIATIFRSLRADSCSRRSCLTGCARRDWRCSGEVAERGCQPVGDFRRHWLRPSVCRSVCCGQGCEVAKSRFARRFRQANRRRNRKVGQGGQVRRYEAGVIRQCVPIRYGSRRPS